MNKMLIAVFDNQTVADVGLHALRKLHRSGDITVYATGVMSKGADGKIHTLSSHEHTPIGTGVGLAVGGLIGLLGGPGWAWTSSKTPNGFSSRAKWA